MNTQTEPETSKDNTTSTGQQPTMRERRRHSKPGSRRGLWAMGAAMLSLLMTAQSMAAQEAEEEDQAMVRMICIDFMELDPELVPPADLVLAEMPGTPDSPAEATTTDNRKEQLQTPTATR